MAKKEDEKGIMKPKEVQDEIKKLEGKIPFFVLKDLGDSLEGKSVTKERFNQIVEAVKERIDQSRIDKKIDGMTSQVTKLAEGFESIERSVGERSTLEVPIERLKRVDENVTTLASRFEENIGSSKEGMEKLERRLKDVEKKASGAKVSIKTLEKLEKKIGSASGDFYGLSRDMCLILGGIDTSQIIAEIIEE
jgi:DNA repair exonuclease SbcCD ATPase subunit